MLRNYVLTALRNAGRNRGVTAINVFGLALAMSVSLLILQVVRVQDSFDEFHEHSDRTYRVWSEFTNPINGYPARYGTAPAMLAQVLEQDVPGIEAAIHVHTGFRHMATAGGEAVRLSGVYADAAFFDVFSFELAAGDPATALSRTGTIVLSAASARRLFGAEAAMGRTVQVDDVGDLEVTGVLKDGRYRTQIPHDAVVSTQMLRTAQPQLFTTWGWGLARSFTFARLEPGVSAEAAQGRLDAVTPARFPEIEGAVLHRLTFESLRDMNLTDTPKGNDIGQAQPLYAVWFLGGMAAVVMLTAGLNYWTLTVARALRRAREVGVRKATGAGRDSLVAQFLVEAAVYVVAASVLAVGLLNVLLAGFNGLSLVVAEGLSLGPELWADPGLYTSVLAFVAVVALAAGLYPAVHLSRFQAATIAKGGALRWKVGGMGLRRLLTVVQFAASLIVVVTAGALSGHLRFLLEIDYGLRRADVVNVRLNDVPYDVFRRDAVAIPGVTQVAGTSLLPAMGSRSDRWMAASAASTPFKGYVYGVDEHFIDVLGLRLLAGRGFDEERADTQAIVINEQAVTAFGFGSPAAAVGQLVRCGGDVQDLPEQRVVGVVADFQSNSLDMERSPVYLSRDPGAIRYACVLTEPGRALDVRERLEAVWDGYGRLQPFDGDLYDRQLAGSYVLRDFADILTMVRFTGLLAVTIACLGLLGIASYSTEARVKEVGIRKAVGATAQGLVVLLSREQLWLIAAATVVAVPAAVWLNVEWLELFPRRAGLSAWGVAGGTLLLVAVATLTVASQTVRAARANPVDSLRYE